MNKPKIYRQNGRWAVELAEPSSADLLEECDCAVLNIRAAKFVLGRNQVILIGEIFAILVGKAVL